MEWSTEKSLTVEFVAVILWGPFRSRVAAWNQRVYVSNCVKFCFVALSAVKWNWTFPLFYTQPLNLAEGIIGLRDLSVDSCGVFKENQIDTASVWFAILLPAV